MIDTHCHLFSKEIKSDVSNIIARAEAVNVNQFIMPNVDSSTIDDLLEIHEKYPTKCLPCIGLHPTSVKENFIAEIELIEKALEVRDYVAVGEIGIDLFHDKTFAEIQVVAFDLQIKLALKHELPIIIHTRKSFDEAFKTITKYKGKNLKGVFHCFSGDLNQAKKIIELGFKLGIGGVVTYKNAGLVEVLSQIPISEIVLETDSPYLPPVPYRGKLNEPSYLTFVVEKLCDIYKCSPQEVDDVTTKNAQQLFNI